MTHLETLSTKEAINQKNYQSTECYILAEFHHGIISEEINCLNKQKSLSHPRSNGAFEACNI